MRPSIHARICRFWKAELGGPEFQHRSSGVPPRSAYPACMRCPFRSALRDVTAILSLLIVGSGAVVQAQAESSGDVPAPLQALGAKIGSHWAFKGTVLSFRADQPLDEEQWVAVGNSQAKSVAIS